MSTQAERRARTSGAQIPRGQGGDRLPTPTRTSRGWGNLSSQKSCSGDGWGGPGSAPRPELPPLTCTAAALSLTRDQAGWGPETGVRQAGPADGREAPGCGRGGPWGRGPSLERPLHPGTLRGPGCSRPRARTRDRPVAGGRPRSDGGGGRRRKRPAPPDTRSRPGRGRPGVCLPVCLSGSPAPVSLHGAGRGFRLREPERGSG